MPRQRNKLKFNVVCWLLGHDVDGKIIAKSFRLVSGEVVAGWQYYCRRCQNPDDFPVNQFPNSRNLYQRTIGFWIGRECNRWRFRNFDRDLKRGRKKYLHQLEEYSSKIQPSGIRSLNGN